ncbi:hypothetical protein P376_1879 [Streptomyces sp. HCCB10043]|nr:hypothetical protein P376_1879 [Streptomyces sp. HCCB10043]
MTTGCSEKGVPDSSGSRWWRRPDSQWRDRAGISPGFLPCRRLAMAA